MNQAVIFDFDNTLSNTDILSSIRESRRYSDLTDDVLSRVHLYRPVLSILKGLREKKVKTGIVTNSGKEYIDILLRYLKIECYFDVVISYTDVSQSRGKPSPAGLLLALERLGVVPSTNVLYIGDSNIDHEAAYRAGITPVQPTWASRESVSIAPSIQMSSMDVLRWVSDSCEYQLFAERCSQEQTDVFRRKEAYFIGLDDYANVVPLKKNVTCLCFGRYFSQKGVVTSKLHDQHPLSQDIKKKDESSFKEVPDYWVGLFAKSIKSSYSYFFGERGGAFDIVTVIPSKKGKIPRLENLLDRIERDFFENSDLRFYPDIFYFLEGAISLKTLGRDDRNFEAQRSLMLNDKYQKMLRGKNILVIDDITTTGATIRRARSLLLNSEVKSVYGMLMAKTVSIIEEEKRCDACGRLMRIKRNSHTGERFFGCTGFYDEERPCNNTEAIEKQDCPRCSRPMRQNVNRATGERFWSCTGWNQEPECNYKFNA